MMNKVNEKCDAEGAMKVLKIIGMVILGIGAAFLFGLVVQLLWNWLMPMIFGLMTLTYWQAIGVLILSCILFGRIGGGSDGDKKDKKGKHPIRDEIKKEIKKEFEKEYGKKAENDTNSNYDEMYEKWWEEEGKDSFEKYANKDKDGE